MRVVRLALALAACGGPASSAPPVVANTAVASAPSASLDQQLTAELAKLPADHFIYVHPVGWFSAQHFDGKTTIYFFTSPAMTAEATHTPSPLADTYPSEKARYRAAISLHADPPDDESDPTVVLRPAWADELGARLHHDLVGYGRASVVGVGRITVPEDPSTPFLMFQPEGAGSTESHLELH